MGGMRFFILSFLILMTYGNYTLAQSNACIESQEFKIVVLGSSTAAGAGVSTSDSAWVNRYAAYLNTINPNNQVINLAVGGYNTYKIMPTGFVPPANRPLADTIRNITTALGLNPDAIIVNMPSNDVASGYTVAEQMQNFNAVQQLSIQSGVPIWICTTQPRNFSSAQAQLQEDLKDSIYVDFAPFVIDFWTDFATSANLINPIYNSGDGVHLNDLGHNLLFERVLDEGILSYLFEYLNYTDFIAKNLTSNVAVCGDSNTAFEFVYANIGLVDSSTTKAVLKLENTTTGNIQYDTLNVLVVLDSCNYDTISFIGNTYEQGEYLATAIIRNQNDTNSFNDTITIGFNTLGQPSSIVVDDTLCNPGNAQIFTFNSNSDTTFWYDNQIDTTPVGFGNLFNTPHIDSTQSWFSQTVRGDLFYSNSLGSSPTSNINWNGTMFDLLSNTDLILDSIDLKINTLGLQVVEVYTKSGSHIGYELDSSAWTLLGSFPVNVTQTSSFTSVAFAGFNLPANDTMGIYLQFEHPSTTLGYQSVSSPNVRSNSELTMITGSGISHDFSSAYYPRDWSGNVYYHFGNKPYGDCSTDRVEATAYVSQTSFDLGADTIIDIEDTVTFYGPNGMASYLWSDGAVTDSTLFIASNEGQGIHHITLEVMDALKCTVTDARIVGVADLVSSVNELNEAYVSVYPNPTSGRIYLDVKNLEFVEVYDLNGALIQSYSEGMNTIDLSNIPNGIYILKVTYNGTTKYTKVIKQ